jgi:hypothetical protein
MQPEKILYLHIGCGKTGSSALQVWLNNEASTLRLQGLDYPVWGGKKLDPYAITSGNGVRLTQAIQAGQLSPFMVELAQSSCSKILLSSETFQGLTDDALELLKVAAAQNGLRIAIIAYVRDVYDVVYSLYLQGVKRHLAYRTFRELGSRLKTIQQFDVLERYRRHFDQDSIAVFHYDTERKRGLQQSMCKAIGVDAAKVPPLPTVKVNRSLDVFEAELLRSANKHYAECFGKSASNVFSSRASDLLIYADPERETEILLDEDVLEHLNSICQRAAEDLNKTFLRDTPMSIFNPEGKLIVREIPALPPSYEILMGAVIAFLSNPGAAPEPRQRPAARNKSNAGDEAALTCSDPAFINALRDEAVRVEKEDLPKAHALMAAAAALRPNGEFISKKLEEYRAGLS